MLWVLATATEVSTPCSSLASPLSPRHISTATTASCDHCQVAVNIVDISRPPPNGPLDCQRCLQRIFAYHVVIVSTHNTIPRDLHPTDGKLRHMCIPQVFLKMILGRKPIRSQQL